MWSIHYFNMSVHLISNVIVWITMSTWVELSVNGFPFERHLQTEYVSNNCSIIPVVSLYQKKLDTLFLVYNEDIALLLNRGHFERHLGFLTLRMWRKNGTQIFSRLWHILLKSNVFAFTKKYTKLQMSLHYCPAGLWMSSSFSYCHSNNKVVCRRL